MNRTEQDFFERVYQIVKKIPYGRVTTYGAIAKSIGSPQAARMVGWAMNKSFSNRDFIPAHRVVNRQGILTGKRHFCTPELMQNLLENEGIVVKNDKIQHFEKAFWDPAFEL